MNGLVIQVQGPTHLDWEEIDRYLAQTLSEWERSRAEEHLVGCSLCRGNLTIKIKSLPFQPLTPDGKPRTPGMTEATLRCGWGRLIGPYLAGRMSSVERQPMESHLAGCEGCVCQMEIYLQSLNLSPRLSRFQQVKQRLQKWGLFRPCFWKRGRKGEITNAQALPLSESSSLPPGGDLNSESEAGGRRAG